MTKKIQREQCEKVTLMDETLKRSYLKKRKELMKMRDRMISENILNGDDTDDDEIFARGDDNRSNDNEEDTDDEEENEGGRVLNEVGHASNEAGLVSNEEMERRALLLAQESHNNVIEYIGLGSNEDVRRRVIEEEDAENERRKKKPRKSGERPDTVRQAADRFSTVERHKALKALGRYSDTVTINTDMESQKRAPRHLVVTMILNEVEATSVDGGKISSDCLKRSKPEFLVVANSKNDCKKVMHTFNSIFTRDASKCKKDLFDVTFIDSQSSNDKSLSAAVNDYIATAKNGRCTLARKPLSVNTIIQNQMNIDSGAVEMRR